MHTDPAPWDDDETAAAPPTPAEEAEHAERVEADLVRLIPDDARDVMLAFRDPASVARYVTGLRSAMVDRVRSLLHAQEAERIEAGPHPTPVTIAPEVRLAADIIDTLEGIAGAMTLGATEAREHAAELLREVTDVKPIGTTSHRFADGHGRDIVVKIEQPTKAETDDATVRDVLAQNAVNDLEAEGVDVMLDDLGVTRDGLTSVDDVALGAYRLGVEAGIDLVLAYASVTWRSTSLKSLTDALAARDDASAQALALSLEHATIRRPHGDPRPKVERVDPTKRSTNR